MKAKKKRKPKGKPINAATFIAKLDAIRTRVRADFGSKDAEIPLDHEIVRDLALLLRVAKAETMYRDVEDVAVQAVQRPVEKKKGQARRDTENDELLRGLGAEGKFNPNAGPEAAPLGRTPRIRRAPIVQPATADTVADFDQLVDLD